MQFLKNDLGLAENFQAYVNIFNKSVPQTEQDYVYILINVSGYIDGKFKIHQYSRRIESTDSVTAIQLTTGQGVMAVLDVWNQGKMDDLKGWVRVEDLDYDSIWASPYSSCYQ
jgi:saccharopine dehydrogenase-like NADP-dependent oxidoreductase